MHSENIFYLYKICDTRFFLLCVIAVMENVKYILCTKFWAFEIDGFNKAARVVIIRNFDEFAAFRAGTRYIDTRCLFAKYVF